MPLKDRKAAQAAAKKSWLSRDLPNWRSQVDDLLKGKQIIVNGSREWNSIYVAAKRKWFERCASRFRILNSRLSPREDTGARSDSSRPGMSISPEMTNLLHFHSCQKSWGIFR